MPQFQFTDTSTDLLRSASVANVESHERMLIERVLADALDVVNFDATRSSVEKLERFGFQVVCAGAMQTWIAPDSSPTGTALSQCSVSGSGWQSLEDALLKFLPERSWPVRHSSCWALEGQGLVASPVAGDAVELSAAKVPPRMMPLLAEGLHALLGPGGKIAVPTDQHEVMAALLFGGFRPASTRLVWTMMPMLSTSQAPALLRDYCISLEEVEAFGRFSGDLNPLHFDDSFAQAHGFSGRITHGMIFNGWVTKLLGTEYPGEGTIFLRNKVIFFAPVYPERKYQIRISTPMMDRSRGSYQILAQLRDEDGAIAMLSYNDVMLRPSQSLHRD